MGLWLLPSELIQRMLLSLALPEIVGLKSLNKSFFDLISDQVFVRDYNSRSRSTTWLFVYKKRWHRDTVLHGFADHSDRWFKLQIADLLKPTIFPGECVYFLAASGNVFLFSSNREVIAVNLATKMVKRLPPSPLGPRGTSSWRRSGMKLASGSNHFRFLFAELVENRPVLFVYTSETDTWQPIEAIEESDGFSRGHQREGDCIFLSVANNGPDESLVMAVGLESGDGAVVVRPKFDGGRDDGQDQLTVGISWGNVIDRLYVYGNGYMLIVKSNGVSDGDKGARMLNEIELWGLGLSGRAWEYKSKVPSRIMEEIKKPYRVIMGCLEMRDGIVRAVLLSNYEGLWDIIWVSCEVGKDNWSWVPLPGCKIKGLNMAGIGFSTGLTL